MPVPFIEQEILEQPEVLARVLEQVPLELAQIRSFEPGAPIHFVGCGDMFFAAEAAAWALRRFPSRRVRAWRSMSLRWAAGQIAPLDTVVCASISGRTQRTIEAARAAATIGARVIALTDNPESPLAEYADHVIRLRTSPAEELEKGDYAGYHHQIPQTKTFSAALLGMLLLGRWISACDETSGHFEPIHQLPDLARQLITPLLETSLSVVPEVFEGRRNAVVLASGPYRPLAEYGAAKLLEYAIPASASCLEEFNHLEIFLADERTVVIVVAPDVESQSRSEELLEVWEDLGVRSLVIGPGRSYPGRDTACLALETRSSSESLFGAGFALQVLAYRAASTLGRDVDRWLGGVRTDLLNATSQRTVRGRRSR